MKKNLVLLPLLATLITSCSVVEHYKDPYRGRRIVPDVITEKVKHDTDDPAIWHHPTQASGSLVVGTDKATDGGLFVFDLEGKIVKRIEGLRRPNNVDVAYGIPFGGKRVDIAVTTERQANQLRVYRMPSMEEIGVIPVFEGEQERSPMGIALYTSQESGIVYAVVGRKSGPSGTYLWQYALVEKDGRLVGELVRQFGAYSGKKEIEAIAVDNEQGYVYYSDEQFGIRKYHADPAKGNAELAVFGSNDFREDMEGISIYKSEEGKGYILVSNQQANTFNVYRREGDRGEPHRHSRIAELPLSTKFSDGSEVSNRAFGTRFPKGFFVAMSEGRVFHYYDWRKLEAEIKKQLETVSPE
ncbi:phytase [Bergeyella sp. RCAD1439]|uniref:phytase n=1 Tax=Bergeyella anatis TaxID=3113737 RepID=UPI002E180434|nr:phytase [Bergeyella sp. RCAD1439]